MNLGQLLLIVLALALLAIVQQTINASITREMLVTMDSEARVNAISVAQAMIDEINSKSFDSTTVSDTVYDADIARLTAYNKLGPDRAIEKTVPPYDREPFQSRTKFDDVDDYNRYTRIDSSFHLGPFIVRDSIIYVQSPDFKNLSTTKTWYKRIIVIVKHPNLVDSVMVKSIAVYRQFL